MSDATRSTSLYDDTVKRMKALLAEGWHGVSNKYRTIAKVHAPPAAEAMSFAPGVPGWLREEMLQQYERWAGEWGARVHGEKRVLDEVEFTIFKKLENGRSP